MAFFCLILTGCINVTCHLVTETEVHLILNRQPLFMFMPASELIWINNNLLFVHTINDLENQSEKELSMNEKFEPP